jgi:hypothetical protein
MADLKAVIEGHVLSLPSPALYDDVLKKIVTILGSLSERGIIALGEDKNLTGKPLEIRTKLLFEKMDFDIYKGRPSLEDFIVRPPSGAQKSDPLVLEVKSSGKPHIRRDDLRQLDDWVFDLSGEEDARKEGLGGGPGKGLAMITHGLMSDKERHPTPHKGVMVFNGPVGMDFSKRDRDGFDENDREFIEKRNFCIISLSVLIGYVDAFQKGTTTGLVLWETIHKTTGMLNGPQQA